EGRLRDIQVPTVDDLWKVPVEERQQQSTDVGTVDVGVRHDDDTVVAELVDVVGVADTRSEGRDQRDDLLAREHLVKTSFLDVEDLAAERENGLRRTIATLLRTTAGAVSLDEKELGLCGVTFLAVRELAR